MSEISDTPLGGGEICGGNPQMAQNKACPFLSENSREMRRTDT